MKFLKVLILAVVAVCTFATADAQVSVRLGQTPHHRHYRHHYHRKVVVVRHHPIRHHH